MVSSRRQLFPLLQDHAREKQGRSPAFVGEPIRQWVMVKLKVIVFVADALVPVTVNVASVGFFVMGGGVPPPPPQEATPKMSPRARTISNAFRGLLRPPQSNPAKAAANT